MQCLVVAVIVTIFQGCYSLNLDEVKLVELNWYMTGQFSKILRDNAGTLSQNITTEQQKCESKITLVSDTCFECNRLISEQQIANAERVELVLESVPKVKEAKPVSGEWKKIREDIVKGLKTAVKKARDFFEKKIMPALSKIKLPKIPDIKLPKVDLPTLPDIKLPKVDLPTLPDIILPKVDLPTIPDIKLPKVDLSSINIPNVNIPEITLPNIQIPKISLPPVDLSKFRLPEITIPNIDFGHFQIPKFTLSKIKLPKISLPKIDIGKILRGKRSITDCQECEQYRTASQENIVKKVCGRQFVRQTESKQRTLDKLTKLYSALEKDLIYSVTFDETTMDYTSMTVDLISIEFKLPNVTGVHTYNATGIKLYLADMNRSAEILAPKLYQEFVN